MNGVAYPAGVLRWVPEDERDGRGWKAPPPHVPRGLCRWCRKPILVPPDKQLKQHATDGGLPAVGDGLEGRERYDAQLRVVAELTGVTIEGRVLYKRATWHADCQYQWELRSNRDVALRMLLERDPSCAGCGLDMVQMAARRLHVMQACYAAVRWVREGLGQGERLVSDLGPWLGYHHLRMSHPVVRALEGLGFDRPTDSLVELDHRIPLWAGGLNEPENFQALCQPCHRGKTSWEAGERARAKRAWLKKQPAATSKETRP